MASLGWIESGVRVAEWLARCGLPVAEGDRAWHVELPGMPGARVTACAEGGFVTLCAAAARLRGAEKLDLGCLLALNARLPGGAKLAIEGKSHRLLILAEVPCDAAADASDPPTVCCRLNQALGGIRTALELLDSLAAGAASPCSAEGNGLALTGHEPSAGETSTTGYASAPDRENPPAASSRAAQSPAPGEAPRAYEIELEFSSELNAGGSGAAHELGPHIEQLRERCLQAGWPASRRHDGALSVVLEVPEGPCAARFEALGAEAVRVRSDPCWPVADEAVCRQAIDYLLLRASGAVRMAGAAGLADASRRGRGPYAWQVRWESLPEVSELDHALTALSVACRQTVREVEALRDRRVAEQYLALQQWPMA